MRRVDSLKKMMYNNKTTLQGNNGIKEMVIVGNAEIYHPNFRCVGAVMCGRLVSVDTKENHRKR